MNVEVENAYRASVPRTQEALSNCKVYGVVIRRVLSRSMPRNQFVVVAIELMANIVVQELYFGTSASHT